MENVNSFGVRRSTQARLVLRFAALLVFTVVCSSEARLHVEATTRSKASQQEVASDPQSTKDPVAKSPVSLESTEDWNRRLRERSNTPDPMTPPNAKEYAIGPEDVLAISVFEAPELNREVRVSASGEISLPLVGAIRAADLTPRALEEALEEALRQKYMKDPHVGVFVREMESHSVSVMGAVRKPGVFQIRGSKTLLEILSLAEGLADDAGEDAIILRRRGPTDGNETISAEFDEEAEPLATVRASSGLSAKAAVGDKGITESQEVLQVNLKELLDSTDPGHNPAVYPGDIVKVSRAGIVYVVGAVHRPGGFALKRSEKISVLQALALSEGLTSTAGKGSARIIRTNEGSGAREETPIDLGKILSGKSPDPMLGSRDIVFVPDSTAKIVLSRGAEVGAQTLAGLLVFHW